MKIQIQPANLVPGQRFDAKSKFEGRAPLSDMKFLRLHDSGKMIVMDPEDREGSMTGDDYDFFVEITHPQLVAALAKPGADILASLTPQKCHLWHMASALLGECMELIEAADLDQEDTENVTEELGDIAFYLEGYRAAMGWELAIPPDDEIEGRESMLLFLKTAGEFFDQTKKHVLYGKPLDEEKTKAAMIRCYQTLAVICLQLDIPWQSVLEANIAKLTKRYPNVSYSDKAAQERADKTPAPDSIHNPENVAEGLLPVGYRFGTWAETGTYYDCKLLDQPVKMCNSHQQKWSNAICQGAPNRTYAVPVNGPDSSKDKHADKPGGISDREWARKPAGDREVRRNYTEMTPDCDAD